MQQSLEEREQGHFLHVLADESLRQRDKFLSGCFLTEAVHHSEFRSYDELTALRLPDVADDAGCRIEEAAGIARNLRICGAGCLRMDQDLGLGILGQGLLY